MRRSGFIAALFLVSCSLPAGDTVYYPSDAPELANASESADGVWESAPWSGPESSWLPYPAQVTIEVEHGLGRVPRLVDVYVSFAEDGQNAGLASGDLARISAVDDMTVTVRNGTNAQLFARIVLQ